MTRRRNQSQDIDTTLWPQVDIHALSPEERAVFTRRQRAIQMYAEGQTIRAVECQTGINRRQLFSLLDRCLMVGVDGAVIGFPALIKYKRLAAYERTADIQGVPKAKASGLAGAFRALLERHPSLEAWLRQKIRERAVILSQISTTDGPKTRLRQLGRLHAEFIQQCRAIGITAAAYPMNTDRLGIGKGTGHKPISARLLSPIGKSMLIASNIVRAPSAASTGLLHFLTLCPGPGTALTGDPCLGC